MFLGRDRAYKDTSSLNTCIKEKKRRGGEIAFEQDLLKNTETTEISRERNPTHTATWSQTEFTHLLQRIWKALVKQIEWKRLWEGLC